MLQYNKLYQSLKKVSAEWHAANIDWKFVYSYFRFYDDGTVLYTTTPDSNEDVDKWLNKNNKSRNIGNYSLSKNNKIRITIPVAVGIIIFEGITKQNSLIVKGQNKETNSATWEYFSLK